MRPLDWRELYKAKTAYNARRWGRCANAPREDKERYHAWAQQWVDQINKLMWDTSRMPLD